MMQGALAEDGFGDEEAAAVIGGAQTLQFEPGSRYCYANQNFRLLSDALQDVCGESFAALLRRHVLEPFGLETAILAADTRALPDGSEGYEGCAETGFRPARNRILWTGDAGLAASLQDMIAWERAIDQGRNDDGSIYQRLSAPSVFKDGRPAAYGFGLAHDQEFGRPITGHGGALRGWRSHRLHCASERLSVVVLFNHLSDARSAASVLFAAALAETSAPAPDAPPPAWTGAYLDPQTGLSARVQSAEPGRVLVRFGHAAERLDLNGANEASGGGVTLVSSAQGLRMSRSRENLECLLQPAGEAHGPAPAGRFVCAELDAEITIAVTGSASYAAFSGPLGRGRMDKLEPIGTGLWLLPCHRALDHTPPGDFTIRAREGQGGAVELEVGCWLARGLRYQRRGLM
jgi:D-aminopeptidase